MRIRIIIFALLLYSLYGLIPTMLLKKQAHKKITQLSGLKNIILTFDDGPDRTYTERLLNLLKKENIKATFFVVAKSADEHPHIINKILEDGHTLGLHALNHRSAFINDIFYTRRDFKESMKIFEKHGWKVSYYRPPHGHLNIPCLIYMKKYGLKLVLWNVIVGDWAKSVTPTIIENRLISQINDNSIVCLHDGRGCDNAPSKTIQALESTLPQLKEEGYNFIPVNNYC